MRATHGGAPASAGAADAWSNFYTSWTAGNHVRTATSLAGAVSFIVALRVR